MATKRIRKREQAIAALLSCRTIKAAAEQCGMGYTNLLSWLRNDEEFKAMYALERKTLLSEIKTCLIQSAVDAAKLLQEGLEDETESYVSRFPLAKFALESALNLEISEAMLQRIEEPENDKQAWDSHIEPESDGIHWPSDEGE